MAIKHILLVDDDKDDCLLFGEALDELALGIKLTTLNRGDQLIYTLQQSIINPPCVIFLDLNMPKKNGFECLTDLKDNTQFKKIPVVIYSTSYDTQVANLMYTSGAIDYIRKPSAFSELKDTLRDTLINRLQDAISV